MRWISTSVLFVLLLSAPMVWAIAPYHGQCTEGGVQVVTQGLISTNDVQASYPQCVVTVYNHGTLTLSTITSDGSTPLGNPFTANLDGSYIFYAADGEYDVVMSGGGFPSPVTIYDVFLQSIVGDLIATNNTWTGINNFSAAANLNDGGNISGTFTGSPTLTGAVSLVGGGALIGSFPGTVTLGVVTATSLSTAFAVNAVSGFTYNGGATSGHVLRGNGTAFVDAALGFSDLSGSAACSQMPALIGDTTSSAGACTTVTGKVNGVTYPTDTSTNTVPVKTSAGAVTYEAVPNAALANSSTTVNGQTCALGGSCTITSANVVTLNKQDPQGSPTSCNAAPQTIYTYSMPGGTLGTGKCLDVSVAVLRTAGTESMGTSLSFGGTGPGFTGMTTGGSSDFFSNTWRVCNNTGSVTAQWASLTSSISDVASVISSTNAGVPIAVNTGNPVTILATITCAASGGASWQGAGWTVVTEP